MAVRRLALVFPGQGDVLEEASEATGLSLRRRMVEGPVDQLTLTSVAQPVLLAMSTAVLRVLQHETELPPVDFVLGHSLGEYSALVAAQALDFADAARLVHLRGLAMQRTVAPGVGAMAALMPVKPEDAELLCQEAAKSTGQVCQVANYNSSKQTVISGNVQAVEAAINQAKATKKARRAVMLDVSAPFHCELMEPARLELHEHLQELLHKNKLREPTIPVVWNVEARPTSKTPEEIAETLEKQVVHAVRWSDSVDLCVEKGVSRFLELGIGGVLGGLIRQQTASKSDLSTTNCGTTVEIKQFLNDQQV